MTDRAVQAKPYETRRQRPMNAAAIEGFIDAASRHDGAGRDGAYLAHRAVGRSSGSFRHPDRGAPHLTARQRHRESFPAEGPPNWRIPAMTADTAAIVRHHSGRAARARRHRDAEPAEGAERAEPAAHARGHRPRPRHSTRIPTSVASLITGSEKAFAAGADIKEMATSRRDRHVHGRRLRRLERADSGSGSRSSRRSRASRSAAAANSP